MQVLKNPGLQLRDPVVAEEPGTRAEEESDPQTPLPTKPAFAEAVLPERPPALGAHGTISLSSSNAGSQLRLENAWKGTAAFAGGEMPLLCPMFTQNACNSSLKHA